MSKPESVAGHTASFRDIDPMNIQFALRTDGALFWNARQDVDVDYLDELCQSILEDGLYEPIVIRQLVDGTYQVVCGECRLRCIHRLLDESPQCYNQAIGRMQSAKIVYKTLTVKLLTNCTDMQASRVSVTENLKRKQLSDGELMQYCHDLCDCKDPETGAIIYTRDDVCKIIARSATWVSQTMSLRDLPEMAKKYLHNGSLPRTVALCLLKVKPDMVPNVLRMSEYLSHEEWDKALNEASADVEALQGELESATIDLSVTNVLGKPKDQHKAEKARDLVDRKLQDAQDKKQTAANRQARLTTDIVSKATDLVPDARKGKSIGMSQKAVRTEVIKMKELITAGQPPTNDQNNQPYDLRDIGLMVLAMQMVLGEETDRSVLSQLSRLYGNEDRPGWE